MKEDNKQEGGCNRICGCSFKWLLYCAAGFAVGLAVMFSIAHMGLLVGQDNQPTKEEIANELKVFLSDYALVENQEIKLIDIGEVGGLVKIYFEIEGDPINFYMTRDGTFLIFEENVKNFEEFKAEIREHRAQVEWRRKSDQFQEDLTPERKEEIAKCLTYRGFVFYGGIWCPFCTRQKELFGEAVVYLPYYECFDEAGAGGNLDKCPFLWDIPKWRGVPTWRDGDGNIIRDEIGYPRGKMCIKRLVELSGCEY